MKRTITSILLAAAAAAMCSASVQPVLRHYGDKPTPVRSGEPFAFVTMNKPTVKATASRADETGFTVTVNRTKLGTDYSARFASIDGEGGSYSNFSMAMEEGEPFVFENVPAGKYLLTVPLDKPEGMSGPNFLYWFKLVNLTADATVEIDPAEVNKIISFTSVFPDNVAPVLGTSQVERPSDDEIDYTGANCREVAAYTTIHSKEFGNIANMGTNMLHYSPTQKDLSSLNVAISDPGVDITASQVRYMLDLDRNEYYTILSVNGADQPAPCNDGQFSEWKYEFVKNPAASKYNEGDYLYGTVPAMIYNGSFDPQGFISYSPQNHPKIFLSKGKLVDFEGYNPNYGVRVYSVEVDITVESDWGFSSDMRGVVSPIVTYDAEANAPVFSIGGSGINGTSLWWNKDDIYPLVMPGNTNFASPANDLEMPLGESAPVNVVSCMGSLENEEFNVETCYLGQYTEHRESDEKMTTVYFIDSEGNETQFEADQSRRQYSELMESGALAKPFTIEIANDQNIVTDGLHGRNITTVKVADPAQRLGAPTPTMLQFRNAAGTVCNKFDKAADGQVMVSGGDFILVDESYYEISDATLKLEYAPEGSDTWKEIPMTKMSDIPAMTEWGYHWTGSLKDVEGETYLGWYKVRLTLSDDKGNSNSQVIYPAFCVKEFAGIATVGNDNNDAPVEYFNLQGQRIDSPAAGQIVIRRQGTAASKVIL